MIPIVMTAAMYWLIAGIALLGFEILVPELIAGAIGLAALVTSVAALFLPVGFQVAVFVGLAITFVIWGRKLVPRDSPALEESRDARALEAIPAGRKGRVRYAGSNWNARCIHDTVSITADQELYVVERQGNTLLVMPAKMLSGDS